MIEWLDNLDAKLLIAINSAHTPLLDQAMWLISSRWIWIPLYILLTAMLYLKLGITKCLFILLTIAALIVATDQTCAHIIKPFVARLRPSTPDNPLSDVMLLVNDYRGGRYSFPSCHAANTFCLATFLYLCFRSRPLSFFLLSWALLVAYSRIYLGVHYPGDILAGCLIGALYALISYALLQPHILSHQEAVSD